MGHNSSSVSRIKKQSWLALSNTIHSLYETVLHGKYRLTASVGDEVADMLLSTFVQTFHEQLENFRRLAT